MDYPRQITAPNPYKHEIPRQHEFSLNTRSSNLSTARILCCPPATLSLMQAPSLSAVDISVSTISCDKGSDPLTNASPNGTTLQRPGVDRDGTVGHLLGVFGVRQFFLCFLSYSEYSMYLLPIFGKLAVSKERHKNGFTRHFKLWASIFNPIAVIIP